MGVAEEGIKGLAKGWAPTLIGYSMQGLCKFGFYEVFKNVYGDMLGEENAYLYPDCSAMVHLRFSEGLLQTSPTTTTRDAREPQGQTGSIKSWIDTIIHTHTHFSFLVMTFHVSL